MLLREESAIAECYYTHPKVIITGLKREKKAIELIWVQPADFELISTSFIHENFIAYDLNPG